MFNPIGIFAVGPKDNILKDAQSLINRQPIKNQGTSNKAAEKRKENPLFFLYIRSCPIPLRIVHDKRSWVGILILIRIPTRLCSIRKRIGHNKRSWVGILIKISPQTPSDAKHTDPFGCKARQ